MKKKKKTMKSEYEKSCKDLDIEYENWDLIPMMILLRDDECSFGSIDRV